MERGVGLGLAEEKWDSLCSSLPCPSLTPSRMLPPGPPPHVHVLFGGCSWFNRRLSHSSDPDHPWGQHDVLGFPVRALCFQSGGQRSSCLAPAGHGKEEVLSPLNAWENCLLLPACQSWPEELALAPAMQGELCGARSWHWLRGRTWCWSDARSSAPGTARDGHGREPELEAARAAQGRCWVE